MTNQFDPRKPHKCKSCGQQYTGYQCKCRKGSKGSGRSRATRAGGRRSSHHALGHAAALDRIADLTSQREAALRNRTFISADIQAMFPDVPGLQWGQRLADALNATLRQYVPPQAYFSTSDCEFILARAGASGQLNSKASDLASRLNNFIHTSQGTPALQS